MQTSSYIKIAVLGCTISYFVGCSPVNFQGVQNDAVSVQQQSSPTPAPTPSSQNYSYTTGVSKTDVLFVIDNTASMFAIQSQIGQKFPTLFNSIKNLDYHIGIINTDVSSSSDASNNNPSRSSIGAGSLPYVQDGNFITFPDGSDFLTKQSTNVASQFLNTISRQETAQCEQYIASSCDPHVGCTDTANYLMNCPSTDSRAIYAALLAEQNNNAGFFRDASVPLNVVIISNSDERASGGILPNYPMQANDQPSTLVSSIQQNYPGKQLQVHSLIVQPGDTNCYSQQDFTSFVFGWYGVVYKSLSSKTGGVIGSVCSTDYSQQLANIAASINTDDGNRTLVCKPSGGNIQVTLPSGITDPYTLTTDGSGNPYLKFSQPLPPGTTVQLQYTCG